MSAEPERTASGHVRLRGNIGLSQMFALGFGSIIGSAWVVVLGAWLNAAGPGGAIVGFLAGGFVVIIVGACYAELTTRLPEAGSEFIYALKVFGPNTAFVTGWFLALYFIVVAIFEGVVIAWLLQVIAPSLASTTLYTLLGEPVTADAVGIGIAGALVLGFVNYRGANLTAAVHSILTYGFLALVLALIVLMIVNGSTANLTPLWQSGDGRPWWEGSIWIFTTCAFLLNGFQAVPQAIEERAASVSLKQVAIIMVLVIGAAVAFYCLVVLASSLALPWRELSGKELASSIAVGRLPYGAILSTLLLVAAIASLTKTWNGVILMAARVLLAEGRAGFLPEALYAVHPRFGSPSRGVLVVVVLNIMGLFLGRGAVLPLINMCSMALTLTFVMCCSAVLVLRRRDRSVTASYQVPGGNVVVWIGLVGSLAMAVAAFVEPARAAGGFPLEWGLLILWLAAGFALWATYVRPKLRGVRP